MSDRAFPVIYAAGVADVVGFYERLGFEVHLCLPDADDPGYVGLRRGTAELAVVHRQWAVDRYGIEAGDAPTFEMFVYVDDADAALASMRTAGATVIREAEDMPWGERVAVVRDPAGNPVSLASPTDG